VWLRILGALHLKRSVAVLEIAHLFEITSALSVTVLIFFVVTIL
jgi:hypothetical protein